MTTTFQDNVVTIDGRSIGLAWPVRDAIEAGDRVFVLLDPNSYLLEPAYKAARRSGAPTVRNLLALNRKGTKLWEAELPETDDYFYRIDSVAPLVASSFSSYRCEIDVSDGTITTREFLK